jgi:hypothetical protein
MGRSIVYEKRLSPDYLTNPCFVTTALASKQSKLDKPFSALSNVVVHFA